MWIPINILIFTGIDSVQPPNNASLNNTGPPLFHDLALAPLFTDSCSSITSSQECREEIVPKFLKNNTNYLTIIELSVSHTFFPMTNVASLFFPTIFNTRDVV